MGWSEAQLYETTPRFFFNCVRAFEKKQEHEDAIKRFEMELQRAGFSAQFNIQLEQKDRLAPADWFPFPWDAQPTPKPTLEENKEIAAEHIRAMGYADGIPVDQFFAPK